ncbi:hypothetical protein ACFL57_04825 [Candidatus Margulisiibacteriota bacterium]
MEYPKYRVRSSIKTFRDLHIYKQTNNISASIITIDVPEGYKRNKHINEELSELQDTSKNIPRLIAESFGDRFSNPKMALKKLEKSTQLISNNISRIDLLNAVINEQEFKEKLLAILKRYQYVRPKILNLKNAWDHVDQKRKDQSKEVIPA